MCFVCMLTSDKGPHKLLAAIFWLIALVLLYWELDHTPSPIQLLDLRHSMYQRHLIRFQYNLLAMTLSQTWRWFPWAITWKLSNHTILSRFSANLVPKVTKEAQLLLWLSLWANPLLHCLLFWRSTLVASGFFLPILRERFPADSNHPARKTPIVP